MVVLKDSLGRPLYTYDVTNNVYYSLIGNEITKSEAETTTYKSLSNEDITPDIKPVIDLSNGKKYVPMRDTSTPVNDLSNQHNWFIFGIGIGFVFGCMIGAIFKIILI